MPSDCTPKLPAPRATISGELVPIPPRRINLKTLGQVRREMAFVYREMRTGSIDTQDGTRYVYVLAQVGKMIELSELERRVAELEANRGRKACELSDRELLDIARGGPPVT